MIIEFIGLPGSGKTYLTNVLCRDKRFKAPEMPRLTNYHRLKCLFSICNSRLFIFYLFKIFLSFNNLITKVNRFTSLVCLSNYHEYQSGNLVYDQHLIQNLIAFQKVLGIVLRDDEMLKLLKLYEFPNNTIIIYNNVTLETAIKRFKLRRNSNNHNKTLLDNLNDEELFKEMQNLLYITQKNIQSLKKNGVQVLEFKLKTSEDIKLFKDEIMNLIN